MQAMSNTVQIISIFRQKVMNVCRYKTLFVAFFLGGGGGGLFFSTPRKVDHEFNNYCDFILQIKVGLAYNSDGELKQRRGSSLPIDVKCNISDITLKRVALDKHLAFNKELPRDHEFLLLYPDLQQVKYVPGTSQHFTLRCYKECLGKPYQRITLYLCDKEDFTGTCTWLLERIILSIIIIVCCGKTIIC